MHAIFTGRDTMFEYWHQEDIEQMEKDSRLRDPMF